MSDPGCGRRPAEAAEACSGEDAVLDVGGEDPRGEPLGGADGVVEPHDQVASVEGHPEGVGVEPVEQVEEFVDGEVGVGLDGDLDPLGLRSGRGELFENLDGKVKWTWQRPGGVASEAVVAVADKEEGVVAAGRSETAANPAGEVVNVREGSDRSAPQAGNGERDWAKRGPLPGRGPLESARRWNRS